MTESLISNCQGRLRGMLSDAKTLSDYNTLVMALNVIERLITTIDEIRVITTNLVVEN